MTPDLRVRDSVGGGTRLALPRLREIGLGPGLALIGLALLVLSALLAPWIAPFDPNAQLLMNRYAPPGGDHLLGTDALGRDQLSRLIFGGRVALVSILVGVVVSVLVGVPAGILAGYRGGAIDGLLGRVFDSLMSFPSLVFAMAFIAVIGPGLIPAMVAIGIMFSPLFFRLARSSTMSVAEEPYIEASRSIGCSPIRLVHRHMLPNVLPPVFVQVAATASRAVSAEASLSFLGFGVQRPTSSWGAMLSDGTQNVIAAPHLVYAPGVAIALTVLMLSVLSSWIGHMISKQEVKR